MNGRTLALAAVGMLTLTTVGVTAAVIWFWLTNPLAIATATNTVDLAGFFKVAVGALYEALVFLLRYL